MVQWIRIHLPMQGMQVLSLAQEDPTCRGTTRPVHHTSEAPHALEPCSATREATAMRSPRSATREKLRAATKTQLSQKYRNKKKQSVLQQVKKSWSKRGRGSLGRQGPCDRESVGK